ncbi:MAG: S1 RNA-binding domain-containing protein [Planctomycetaceae bacterium]
MESAVLERLAGEFNLDPAVVGAALRLLRAGEPIPFLARYRRESVGGLDEPALRALRAAAAEFTELEERRAFVLQALAGREEVPEKLRRRIERSRDAFELESLYMPYRPPRRTRATLAKEQGFGPLAEALLQAGTASPAEIAAPYVDAAKGVADATAALAEAQAILVERFACDAEARAAALRSAEKEGLLKALPPQEREAIGEGHAHLRGYEERLSRIPAHRFLSAWRAAKEGAIQARLEVPEERTLAVLRERHFPAEAHAETLALLAAAATEALRRVIGPAVAAEALSRAQTKAEREVVGVLASNLRDLLLYPPAGARRVLGVNPARRGPVHLACVDERGNPVGYARVRPFSKEEAAALEAREAVARLCATHAIAVVAVGNGQGRHECEAFLHEALATLGDGAPPVVTVNEAGVGAYATGPVGRGELPAFPVPVRAAISIARRLIDPIAELVKVETRNLCGGQYASDVDPERLERSLGDVVEHCVSAVGVDLNRAGVHQLSYVCGMDMGRARVVVEHREKSGPFPTRAALAAAPGMTPKAYERAAGFFRIAGGSEPLDATGLHPADAAVVARIAAAAGVEPRELVGNADRLAHVSVDSFADETHSASAVASILSELLEGGRDPRPPLVLLSRAPGIRSAEDLKPGMRLPGRVTNVTPFGAFVDIGVRQDGLVHVSQLSDRFVRDPTNVVRVGEMVEVRVLEVDADTKRISLSMKSEAGGGGRGREGGEGGEAGERPRRRERGRGPRREEQAEREGREHREPRRRRREREVEETFEEPREIVAPAARDAEQPSEPENPVPDGMTEEEFVKRKLEELRRRFS